MKVNLPVEILATDYHDFLEIADNINSVLIYSENPKKPAVSFVETGFWDGKYHAYFHKANHKPKPEEILSFYVESKKGLFNNAKELKEYFQEGWLEDDILKNIDNVIKHVSKDKDFFKAVKKSYKRI